MAAWLAYLKSALLLPREEQEDPSPEELALRLQLRLQRLGAMREAAARLMARDRLGRDVFLRGAPEGLRIDRRNRWQCEWFDLVQAYGQVKARTQPVVHMVRDRMVMTLDSAIARVSAMLGVAIDWMELRDFLPAACRSAPRALGAGLELRRRARTGAARQGRAGAGRDLWPAAAAADAQVMIRRQGDDDLTRAVEATLFAAGEPMTAEAISAHLGGAEVRGALARARGRTTPGAGSNWSSAASAGTSRPRPTSPTCSAASARTCAGCRAPRPKCWRSSPITSR